MNPVEVDSLGHVYPAARRGGAPRTVLHGLSFSVTPGEIFGLLGPNGGGKTTLFRILSTAITPTSGRATIFGADVVKDPEGARRAIGVVFQNPSLDRQLTLLENLIHQGHLYGLRGPDLRQRALDALARLSVKDRANDIVSTLSGGLQRRGEIAKGLLHRPKLLILDEPSTGLDVGARREMWEALDALRGNGVTVLLTTHLMDEAEKCDRIAIIHQGLIVAIGSPADLKKRIGGDVVTIQSPRPQALAEDLRRKFGGSPVALGGSVRLEIQEGHRFIPQAVEAFPGAIESITVGKPTLEDVFVHETGRSFWSAEESAR